MPVLSDHLNPNRQATAGTSTSTYLLVLFAILLTLGVSFSRRKRNEGVERENRFSCKRKNSWTRIMQEPSIPTPGHSALPGKPYSSDSGLPPYETEHQQSASNTTNEKEEQQSYSPITPNSQQSHSPDSQKTTTVILSAKPTPSPRITHQPLPGSVSAGNHTTTTSALVHPDLPAPTISMSAGGKSGVSMTIQTGIPYQDHTSGSYTQNEILFVPSPTEYTSFEALYSKFPPPIYHSPNPASYSSDPSLPDGSSSNSHSFNTTQGPKAGPGEVNLPRRRSYTKTLSNGSEVSGEIVVSGVEGGQWRRHTRVFGGGVCRACEESESRRMSA